MKTETIGNVEIRYLDSAPADIYCEGEEVENRVLQVFRDDEDPIHALRGDDRWPLLYQLSPSRGNIVAPMGITKAMSVLELGAGMGAITSVVAGRCANVDAVDMSPVRCRANAYRNKRADNVRIYVGDILKYDTEERYDVVLLIGVLEYAAVYGDVSDPHIHLLRLCHRFLKPGGKLYIAIENRLGAKYLAGCVEDHLGKPFPGVEGYIAGEKVRTFTRTELLALVHAAGFADPFFYYPLPDYKLPNVIYSDAYLPTSELKIPYRSNYDADRLLCFEDVRLLQSVCGTDEFRMLANSFLLEVRK